MSRLFLLVTLALAVAVLAVAEVCLWVRLAHQQEPHILTCEEQGGHWVWTGDHHIRCDQLPLNAT